MRMSGIRSMRPRGTLITAIDVGTSKLCCLIARIEEDGRPKVIGIGHHVSRGVRNGAIINLEHAGEAIGRAVQAAEDMAGETVRTVVVNLSGEHLHSHSLSVRINLGDKPVSDADLTEAFGKCGEVAMAGETEVIHAVPIRYTLDHQKGIRDPRGMFGHRLGVDLHVVTAAVTAMKTLTTGLEHIHLGLEMPISAAYASGLSVLVEDEAELGCTVIDMGAGTTTIAVFNDGELIHTDCLPVGGTHVTNDIARGLTTSIVHAERMKTLQASAIPSSTDDHEEIEVPQIGEDDPGATTRVPRSLLVGIVRPRIEETFELVRQRLEYSGYDKYVGRRVVLTGGACQIGGAREIAQRILEKQVRIGRPVGIDGLAEMTQGPAFAVACGLLKYAMHSHTDIPRLIAQNGRSHGVFSRIGNWLMENF